MEDQVITVKVPRQQILAHEGPVCCNCAKKQGWGLYAERACKQCKARAGLPQPQPIFNVVAPAPFALVPNPDPHMPALGHNAPPGYRLAGYAPVPGDGDKEFPGWEFVNNKWIFVGNQVKACCMYFASFIV